jgi:hypothetical protein
MDTIKKNTETSTDNSKGVGVEVNTEKTKYMLLSRHQNAGQNHDIKIADRCLENVAHFEIFGNDSNKIKTRPNSGNICYHSVQNLMSPHLLSKT